MVAYRGRYRKRPTVTGSKVRSYRRRRYTAMRKPPMARKPRYKKRISSVSKLARQIQNLKVDQYEKQQWRYNWSSTSLLEITCDPMIADPTVWYRMFSSVNDSPITNKAWLNNIRFDYRFQMNLNTPQTNPIWIYMYIVIPKWRKRQTVSSTTVTLLNASQLSGDVDYSWGNTNATFPVINKELYYILATRKIALFPNITNALGQYVYATNPRDGMRKGYINIKPRAFNIMAARNKAWNTVPLEDIPYTKQIYCITFASYSETVPQPASVNLTCEYLLTYNINQIA